jgi:hypothetical protein
MTTPRSAASSVNVSELFNAIACQCEKSAPVTGSLPTQAIRASAGGLEGSVIAGEGVPSEGGQTGAAADAGSDTRETSSPQATATSAAQIPSGVPRSRTYRRVVRNESAAPQPGYPVRDRYVEVVIGSCPSFSITRSKSSCGWAPGIITRSSTTQAGTPPAPISSIAADDASIRS